MYNIKTEEYTKNRKRNILCQKLKIIDMRDGIVYYDKCKKNTIEGVYMYETGNC